MRQHKYKAWHKELKRMFKVDWFNCNCGENGLINCSLVPMPKIKEVILIESIGLKDIHGKEIYGDCDLLADNEGVIYMVKWWKQKAEYHIWFWDDKEWEWELGYGVDNFYEGLSSLRLFI